MLARLLIAVVVVTSSLIPAAAFAARANMSRQEIKSKSMLERPYRVGHFYGNTARRNARDSGQLE